MERHLGTYKNRHFTTFFWPFSHLFLLGFAPPSLGQNNKLLGEYCGIGLPFGDDLDCRFSTVGSTRLVAVCQVAVVKKITRSVLVLRRSSNV